MGESKMNKKLKIDQCYCWVIDDDENGEGVPAFNWEGMAMPLFGADLDRVISMKPIAEQAAKMKNKPIELRHFKGPYTVFMVVDPKDLKD